MPHVSSGLPGSPVVGAKGEAAVWKRDGNEARRWLLRLRSQFGRRDTAQRTR
jgi:hypothetical protein